MYVDTLSGSTVSMLNRFMSQKEEEYMIISDRFCIIGDNKEFYISFVLGKMADVMQILDNKLMHSSIIMSELKKACGKRISIDAVEIKLRIDDLCLHNITLPVYALLKKCFNMIKEEKNINYEQLIRFEKPIDINAQCDNRGGYNVFQYYGETSSFPLVGFVMFKEKDVPYKYDYNKIKL